MNTIIRKISVGNNYPDGALHYQVKSFQMLKRKRYQITRILFDKELFDKVGKLSYNIYIQNVPEFDAEIVSEVLWKTVVGLPIVVENNIDFD